MQPSATAAGCSPLAVRGARWITALGVALMAPKAIVVALGPPWSTPRTHATVQILGVLVAAVVAVAALVAHRRTDAVERGWWFLVLGIVAATSPSFEIWWSGRASSGVSAWSSIVEFVAISVGMVGLSASPRHRDRLARLDGVLVVYSGASVWILLLWNTARPPVDTVILVGDVAVAQAFGGSVVVGVLWICVVRLLVRGGHAVPADRYLIAGTLAVVLFGPPRAFALFSGAGDAAWALDSRPLAATCFAAAALRADSRPADRPPPTAPWSRARYLIPLLAFVGPVVGVIASQSSIATAALVGAVLAGGLGLVVARSQVTIEALREVESDLDRLAHTDPLTGLVNRRGLQRIAEQAPGPLRLVFVDMDGFKAINDRYGHVAGDAVLAAVGARLRSFRPAPLAACRVGGDEFALLIEDRGDDPADVGAALRSHLGRPVALDEATVAVSVGIGISAHHPGTAEGIEALYAEASGALGCAKRQRSPHPVVHDGGAHHGATQPGDRVHRPRGS